MSQLNIKTPRWAVPLLYPKRYKGAKGGRGGGKSHFFAEMSIELMVQNVDFNIVCIREIQKSLKFSAKKLTEDKIREMGVSHLFDITLTEIRRKNGKGVMIFQGMQDHTADSIKSLEAFDVAWVEEAQSISERSLELLLPTIRAENSEIWFSWNPYLEDDAVDKFFSKKSEDKILVEVNYTENPFATDVIIQEANRHKVERPDTFNNIWLGEYAKSGLIFKRDMFKFKDEIPKDLFIFSAVDIAMSQEESADQSCIITIGQDTANNLYVLEIQAGRWNQFELKEYIISVCKRHNPTLLGIEKTTASWHFVESFKEIMRVRNIYIPFTELKPSGRGKNARIESYLLSSIQQSRLYFNCNAEELIKEAISFPSGKHDDLIDTLSYCVEMSLSRPRQGESESIEDDNVLGWL